MVRSLVLVVLCLCNAARQAPPAPQEETPLLEWDPFLATKQVQKDYETAKELKDEELYVDSETLLLSILSSFPTHQPALVLLAKLYQEGNIERGFRWYYLRERLNRMPLEQTTMTGFQSDVAGAMAQGANMLLEYDLADQYFKQQLAVNPSLGKLTGFHTAISENYIKLKNWKKALVHVKKNFKGGRPDGEKVHAKMAQLLLSIAAEDTSGKAPKIIKEAKKVLLKGLHLKQPMDPDVFFVLKRNFHKKNGSDFNLADLDVVKKAVIESGWQDQASSWEDHMNYDPNPTWRGEGWSVPRHPIVLGPDGQPDWSPITKCMEMRIPCTFRGEGSTIPKMMHWQTHKWDEDYLRARAGHVLMNVEKRRSNDKNFGSANAYYAMNFSDILTSFAAKTNNVYLALRQTAFSAYNPPLWDMKDDIPLPTFLPGGRTNSINLWMSGSQARGAPEETKNTTSGLHFDNQDNINMLVKGKKIFRIVPPEHANCVYPAGPISGVRKSGKVENTGSNPQPQILDNNFAFVNLDQPDYELFPKSKDMSIFELHMQAGDMLFLPTGWFHQVSTKGPTLGINFWYDAPLDEDEHDRAQGHWWA